MGAALGEYRLSGDGYRVSPVSEGDDRYGFPESDAPSASPVREPSPSLLLALAAGLVAAVIGGVLWGLIVKWANYEVGIVAWAIGFLAGTAVVTVTRGARGSALQGIAVASALLGILIGKYLSFAFVLQDQASAQGIDIGVFSSEMRTLFQDNLGDVFGLFDLLWVGFAVFTAWRIPGVETQEPAATPPAP